MSEHGHLDVRIYNHPDSIRGEVDRSLARLQTDRIDLYQTHWQDPTTPIAETMGVLLELKAAGKIRAIGVCNASAEQMGEYWQQGQLDSDQEKYSMLDRQIESEQLPFCRERRMAVLAYSPLAMGMLTGKMGPEREFDHGDIRGMQPRFSRENRSKVATLLQEFEPIAERYGLSIPQLVIAWTASQPGVTHVLCGARTPAQAEENAAAGRAQLSSDDQQQMTTLIERHATAIV
jgi:aryl-alcohol dehydrogenase-like predicted oxidoreductase